LDMTQRGRRSRASLAFVGIEPAASAVGGGKSVDFGTQHWYTRLPRVHEKWLILMSF